GGAVVVVGVVVVGSRLAGAGTYAGGGALLPAVVVVGRWVVVVSRSVVVVARVVAVVVGAAVVVVGLAVVVVVSSVVWVLSLLLVARLLGVGLSLLLVLLDSSSPAWSASLGAPATLGR